MKNILSAISVSILCLFITCCHSQPHNEEDLAAKIDALIPPAVSDTTPGLVIGIVKDGKLIFKKGYGMANLTYGIRNNPQMVYNIGSVSKQFIGYAFAMLHVAGEVNIDDPVNKYLEEWPVFKHPVTIRHLLTHSSGYREAYTLSNLAGRFVGIDRLSKEECLNVVRNQSELEFIPGSRYTYNSTAWVILAEIFEKVKGMSAEDWIQTNMLDVLGMEHTQIETYVGEVMNNAAESYTLNDEKKYRNEKSNRAIFGGADVLSSIEDLAKWINNYKLATLGGKEVTALFFDPLILNDGSDSNYALGIRTRPYRGLKLYRHTGGHEAFSTDVCYFPDYDLGIITISNFGDYAWLSTTKIAALFLEEHMTPEPAIQSLKVNKKQLESLEGIYVKKTLNNIMELKIVDDNLTINGRQVLIPVENNTFTVGDKEGNYTLKILNDSTLEFITASRDIYKKINPWKATTAELMAYQGDYWSEEIATLYHLTIKNDLLVINHRWIGMLPLKPVYKDFFSTKHGWYIKFNRDQQGAISGLSIYSERTLNVKFQRQE